MSTHKAIKNTVQKKAVKKPALKRAGSKKATKSRVEKAHDEEVKIEIKGKDSRQKEIVLKPLFSAVELAPESGSSFALDSEPKFQSLKISAAGKRILVIFMMVAIFSILFILFIALPTATVYLEPLSREEVFVTSVTFADQELNQQELLINQPHFIATFPISFTLELSREYPATGELVEGEAARGEITVYNRGTKPKHFVPSRFQTEDGLIFWADTEIDVPARTDEQTPGEITVPAHAADYDAFGRHIGDRGNISAQTQLKMPAIPYLSPLLYYGMNKKSFTGGTAVTSKIILKEDLQLARDRIETELAQKAEKLMKERIADRNQVEQSNKALLTGEGTFDYEVNLIEVDNDLLGQKRDTFPATVQMTVMGRIYNRDDLYRILIEGLKEKLHPDMILDEVDFVGMEMMVIDHDDEKGRIHINIEIHGRTVYDFNPESETGQRLIARIRAKLAGQTVNWSEKYLQNLKEITTADVVTWPFWRDKLPAVEGNIEIKVK